MHALLNDAYVHADDIRAALGEPFDRGPGLYASLDFVLSALARDEAASAEPRVAWFLDIRADDFAEVAGMDAHDFVLVATGRLNPDRFGLPETVNIFR